MTIHVNVQSDDGAKLYVKTEYQDGASLVLIARDRRTGMAVASFTLYRLPQEQIDLLRQLPKDRDYAYYVAFNEFVTDHALADHLYGCYRWGVCEACEGSGENQEGAGCAACNGLGHRPPGFVKHDEVKGRWSSSGPWGPFSPCQPAPDPAVETQVAGDKDPEALLELIERSVERFNALSVEEKQRAVAAQRESWVRGESRLDRPDAA